LGERIMDLMSTAQLLGNFGEFVGAIAVVATLFYLTAQVKQNRQSVDANTLALEDERKVRLAETYQSRLHNMSANTRLLADSESLADIAVRVNEAGYPSVDSLEVLNPVERFRWRSWTILQFLNIENLHYQYELGLLEPEFYEKVIVERISELGEVWEAIGLTATIGRPGFHKEIEKILNRSDSAGEEL
jgi:hypothetical protein